MLSFSSLSELPLAAAVTELDASAYMVGASATSSAGSLTIHLTADLSIASVTGTTTASALGDVDAQASTGVTGDSASTAVGTLNAEGQAGPTLTGVTATTTAASAFGDLDAQASITLPAATAAFTASAFGDVDAQASITLTSAAASADLTVNDIEDADAQASGSITGVSASTASGTLSAIGEASPTLSSALGTTTAGTLQEFIIQVNVTLPSAAASADLTVNDFADEAAEGTATVSGVSASGATNWDTTNGVYAVQVVFLADDIDRDRTVNVVPYGNYTVYVTR